MDLYNEFFAIEKPIVFYSGKAVIDRVHAFFDINGDDWSFASATGYSFKIFQERNGRRLILWEDPVNLTQNSNDIILNAPIQDTALDIGNYYYEIAYYDAGAYEILLAYGEAKFI